MTMVSTRRWNDIFQLIVHFPFFPAVVTSDEIRHALVCTSGLCLDNRGRSAATLGTLVHALFRRLERFHRLQLCFYRRSTRVECRMHPIDFSKRNITLCFEQSLNLVWPMVPSQGHKVIQEVQVRESIIRAHHGFQCGKCGSSPRFRRVTSRMQILETFSDECGLQRTSPCRKG